MPTNLDVSLMKSTINLVSRLIRNDNKQDRITRRLEKNRPPDWAKRLELLKAEEVALSPLLAKAEKDGLPRGYRGENLAHDICTMRAHMRGRVHSQRCPTLADQERYIQDNCEKLAKFFEKKVETSSQAA